MTSRNGENLAFANKVALITGGTRGIGLSIAQAYLALGAKVMITGQSEATLATAAVHLGDASRWSGAVANFAVPDGPARAVGAVLRRFGTVDVLVNNVGMAGTADLWKTEVAEWDRIQAVNLRATFFCAREATTAMKAGGHGGVIINMSSVAAEIGGAATGPAYVASKAGIIGLTRSLARHFAPWGIRVNCIAPADIDSAMTASWPAALRERVISLTPLGRFGRPDEVAATAVFLASDAASYITGQTINVNGGMYMG